jgi:hypothetical protein
MTQYRAYIDMIEERYIKLRVQFSEIRAITYALGMLC